MRTDNEGRVKIYCTDIYPPKVSSVNHCTTCHSHNGLTAMAKYAPKEAGYVFIHCCLVQPTAPVTESIQQYLSAKGVQNEVR